MHIYDTFCEHLLNSRGSADALKWINSALSNKPRTIGSLDTDDTKYIVGYVIAKGALRTRVLGDHDVIHTYGSADALLIDLPDDPFLRSELFEIENQVASETGFDATFDEGQRYLFIRWK